MPAFHFNQKRMRRRTLGQFRRSFVEGEHIGVAMLFEGAKTPRLVRVVPGTRRKLDHARSDCVSDMGSGKARTAFIVDKEQISFTDSAARGIVRIDPQRFATMYLLHEIRRRRIKLTMQTQRGLV